MDTVVTIPLYDFVPRSTRLTHLVNVQLRGYAKMDFVKLHPCNVSKYDLECFFQSSTRLQYDYHDYYKDQLCYFLEKSPGRDGRRRFIKKTYPVVFPKPSTGWKVYQSPFSPESLGKNPLTAPYPFHGNDLFKQPIMDSRWKLAGIRTVYWRRRWKNRVFEKAMKYYNEQKRAYKETFFQDLQFSPDMEDPSYVKMHGGRFIFNVPRRMIDRTP